MKINLCDIVVSIALIETLQYMLEQQRTQRIEPTTQVTVVSCTLNAGVPRKHPANSTDFARIKLIDSSSSHREVAEEVEAGEPEAALEATPALSPLPPPLLALPTAWLPIEACLLKDSVLAML